MNALASLLDPRPALAAHGRLDVLHTDRVRGVLSPDDDETDEPPIPPSGNARYVSYAQRLEHMRRYAAERRKRMREAR